MKWLHSKKIGKKITYVMTLNSFITLFIATIIFLAYDIKSSGELLVDDVKTQAVLIGNNVTAALLFKDNDTAKEILHSLKSKSNIIEAALYDADNQIFEQYSRAGGQVNFPKNNDQSEHFQFRKTDLIFTMPIHQGSELLGKIVIRASLDKWFKRMKQYLLLILIVLIGSSMLSFVTAMKLAKLIVSPIHKLIGGVRNVIEHNNFSIRVEKTSTDELGQMTDDFNEMLEEIDIRDKELLAISKDLEKKVKERTFQLEIERNKAIEADQMKTNFLANMSHEIRTPMTAILGFTDLILDPKQSSEEMVYNIKTIKNSGTHLLSIINDILDISKIEAGKMTVEQVEFSPMKLLGDIVAIMSSKATEKGLRFETSFEGRVPEIIRSDPVRLRQILMNIIGNSIKFTNEGEIRIVVDSYADDEGLQMMRFRVKDTGIGIDEAKQKELFVPFKQADSSTTRKFGGTGLGLAISKKLTQILGGDITIASTAGLGAMFTVTISFEENQSSRFIEEPSLELIEDESLSLQHEPINIQIKAKILLAEDGLANQKLVSYYLKKVGCNVDIVDNGKKGLEAAMSAWNEDCPYDIFICDMQMPIMDGYTAVSKLRRQGYDLPIIALTAHAMSGDRQKCLDAGCDEYATKPIDNKQLIDLVMTYSKAEVIEINKETEVSQSAIPLDSVMINDDDDIVSDYARTHPDMGDLINEFIDHLAIYAKEMEEAFDKQNYELLGVKAHQIKGCGKGYGFAILTDEARKLENNIKAELSRSSAQTKLSPSRDKNEFDVNIVGENLKSFIKLCQRIKKM
ncbi:MAG: response regulator [Methylococcales bacterium]|jgi:two-component system, sensor histidine kinase|nr:response regulator [Methylococcales bacterium]